MQYATPTMLRIGAWCVNPASGEISRDGETTRVEARTMRLLQCLAERPGEVVSIDDLLSQVWPDVTVSQDSVYQAVTSLRRLLGDDPKQPTYIATVPRLGYRMVATVGPWADQSVARTGAQPSAQTDPPKNAQTDSSRIPDREDRTPAPPLPKKSRVLPTDGLALASAAALCLAFLVAFLFRGKLGNHHLSATPAIASEPQ